MTEVHSDSYTTHIVLVRAEGLWECQSERGVHKNAVVPIHPLEMKMRWGVTGELGEKTLQRLEFHGSHTVSFIR